MSKGNVILGQARGSVGDVTFYRAYGEQIARSRNRHPRNPKTSAQKVQRAVMATVLRAYSLGKNIFDHSFEGVGVGMPSMRRFLSQNVKLMRTSIVGALNGGTVSPYRVAAPGVNIPIANAYVVSSGTLQQTFFTYGSQGYAIPEVGEATTVAEYVAANQLQEGDIFTFVGFFAKPTDPAVEYVDPEEGPIDGMCIAQCYFGYEQLMVKAGAASDTTEVTANTELSAIFEVIGTYAPASEVISQKKLGDYVTIGDLGQPDYVGAWGVIMSREASGLRSNCTLHVEGADSIYGITTPYLIRAWSSEGSYADPSLILEGSNFNTGGQPTPTVRPRTNSLGAIVAADAYYLGCRMTDGSIALLRSGSTIPTAEVPEPDTAAGFRLTESATSEAATVTFTDTASVADAQEATGVNQVVDMDAVLKAYTSATNYQITFKADDVNVWNDFLSHGDTNLTTENFITGE